MDYLTDIPELDEPLIKQVAGLPIELQNILKSDVIEVFARAVSQQYSLTEEEEEATAHELMLVILTIESVDSLLVNLISEALLAPETAEKIVDSAKKDFFAPFIQFLKQKDAVGVPVSPQVKPIETSPLEKPYIEEPLKKASYGAILDVPNYSAVPKPPEAPAPIVPQHPPAIIPQTPALRVQPGFEAPTSAPRPPQKILADTNTPPHA